MQMLSWNRWLRNLSAVYLLGTMIIGFAEPGFTNNAVELAEDNRARRAAPSARRNTQRTARGGALSRPAR